MDIVSNSIENQQETVLNEKKIKGFGLSLQGASHILNHPPTPCQDAYDMRFLKAQGILIAAIADGVGSCPLSHWGAHTAVSHVLDKVQESLIRLSKGKSLKLSAENPAFMKKMKAVMLEGFQSALYAVEALAYNATPPQTADSLQSTLTLAIYDGDCLFHGHVGDDGIVAQLPNGDVEMATSRLKGEEANSVFPLQSGEAYWYFGVVPHVVGFVMATDGVLDSFVASAPNCIGNNYFNGVCYQFMEDAIYTLAGQEPNSPQKALQHYKDFLMSDSYRQQVNDDLTLLAFVAPQAVQSAEHPAFNMDQCKKSSKGNAEVQHNALYGDHKPVGPGHDNDKKPDDPESDCRQNPVKKVFTDPACHAVPDTGQICNRKSCPDTYSADQYSASCNTHLKKQKRRKKHSTAIRIIRTISTVFLIILVFLSGVFIGRVVIPPVSVKNYQELQKSYSDLQEQFSQSQNKFSLEKDSLTSQLEEVQADLDLRNSQIKSLKDIIGQLQNQLSVLDGSEEVPDGTVETTPETVPEETVS